MPGVGGPLLCIGDLLNDVADDSGGDGDRLQNTPSALPTTAAVGSLSPHDLEHLFQARLEESKEVRRQLDAASKPVERGLMGRILCVLRAQARRPRVWVHIDLLDCRYSAAAVLELMIAIKVTNEWNNSLRSYGWRSKWDHDAKNPLGSITPLVSVQEIVGTCLLGQWRRMCQLGQCPAVMFLSGVKKGEVKEKELSDTEDDSAIVLSKMRRTTVKGKPKKKNDKENWPIYPGRDALCPKDREMITLVMDRYPDGDSIVIERGNIFISRSSLTDILGTGWVCFSHLDTYAYVLNSLKEKDENNMINFLFVSSNHAMRYLQEDTGDVLPKDIALWPLRIVEGLPTQDTDNDSLEEADRLVLSANSNSAQLLEKIELLQSILKRGDAAVLKAMEAVRAAEET
ncbi:hypothetical protein KSP39_PZI016737 [Platanthera zijinensis]|uniref:Uncharacterized protein n=1 Tax=Platanthera zijinensis TaxID=2320716 RepID=A0AAP0B828_9ASPA